MAKTNISMPDGMLEDVDRRAEVAGVTRSGFIQEAIAHYTTALDTEQARSERAERIGKAMELARSCADKVGAPDAAKLIRQSRDEPPRWMKP